MAYGVYSMYDTLYSIHCILPCINIVRLAGMAYVLLLGALSKALLFIENSDLEFIRRFIGNTLAANYENSNEKLSNSDRCSPQKRAGSLALELPRFSYAFESFEVRNVFRRLCWLGT